MLIELKTVQFSKRTEGLVVNTANPWYLERSIRKPISKCRAKADSTEELMNGMKDWKNRREKRDLKNKRRRYEVSIFRVPDREKGTDGEEEIIKQIMEERPIFLDKRGVLNSRRDQCGNTHASGHSEKRQISKGQ